MTKAIVIIVSGLIFLIGSISEAKIPKIIGGNNAVIKDFPYLVSIREYGKHNCGGSIISNRHILTAAHCVDGMDQDNTDDLTIHSGTSRTDRDGYMHKVLSVHVHPKFDITNAEGGYPYDIAIITLENPIVFDKHQQKINLPSHDVQNYQAAYLVGWGTMSKLNWDSAKQLQKLRVALLPSDKCKSFVRHKMNPEQLCSFRSPTSGACHGDSGGPLVSQNEIVGIVSYGDIGECAGNVPDIYTDVFAYKDFIESIMNE